MYKILLAVKINAPKMGTSGESMRLLGQTEIARVFSQHPEEADMLRAWASEIKHRRWPNAETLSASFLNADLENLPVAVFRAGNLKIQALINFSSEVVLVTHIHDAGHTRLSHQKGMLM